MLYFLVSKYLKVASFSMMAFLMLVLVSASGVHDDPSSVSFQAGCVEGEARDVCTFQVEFPISDHVSAPVTCWLACTWLEATPVDAVGEMAFQAGVSPALELKPMSLSLLLDQYPRCCVGGLQSDVQSLVMPCQLPIWIASHVFGCW